MFYANYKTLEQEKGNWKIILIASQIMFYANDGSRTKKWTSSFCNYYGHMNWTHFVRRKCDWVCSGCKIWTDSFVGNSPLLLKSQASIYATTPTSQAIGGMWFKKMMGLPCHIDPKEK